MQSCVLAQCDTAPAAPEMPAAPAPPPAVSRSEAGQPKALLVLDAQEGWRVVEEVPLDVGPRHYEAGAENLQGLLGGGMLRPGDRCAVLCSVQAAQTSLGRDKTIWLGTCHDLIARPLCKVL